MAESAPKEYPPVPPPSRSYVYTFRPSPEFLKARPKKLILTVDGGGLRGMIPARLLEELENMLKRAIMKHPDLRVVGSLVDKNNQTPTAKDGAAVIAKGEFNIFLADYFDVMSGTSTGSIITAYLATKGDVGQALLNGDPDVIALDQQKKAELTSFDPKNYTDLKKLLDRFHTVSLVPGSCRAIQATFVAKAHRIFPKDNIEAGQLTTLQKFANAIAHAVKFPIDVPTAHAGLHVKYGAEGIDDTLKKAFQSPKAGEEGGLLSNSLHTSLIIPTIQLDKSRTVSFFYHHDNKHCGYATLRRGATKEEQDKGDKMAADMYDHFEQGAAQKRKQEQLQLPSTPDLIYVPEVDFDLWQVVRSSTAAPTYFPPCKLQPYLLDANGNKPKSNERKETWSMVDGGVTSNNPGMSAVVFASAIYKEEVSSLEDLAVFSLGCGTTVGPINVKDDDGFFGWGQKLIGLLMGGNQELSSALVEHFVAFPYKNQASKDPSDRFVRIQKTADLTAVDGDYDPTGANKLVKIGSQSEVVAKLLSKMDDADCAYLYHQLAEEMLADNELKIKEQMELFVNNYVLPSPKNSSSTTTADVAARDQAGRT